jgi:hypothetical protein
MLMLANIKAATERQIANWHKFAAHLHVRVSVNNGILTHFALMNGRTNNSLRCITFETFDWRKIVGGNLLFRQDKRQQIPSDSSAKLQQSSSANIRNPRIIIMITASSFN